ncbi:MAG TPA: hypothetical protein PKD91_11145 [Bacteroidia bacterium]|nr:hypothetical protein [Bacteroidia bacterium]
MEPEEDKVTPGNESDSDKSSESSFEGESSVDDGTKGSRRKRIRVRKRIRIKKKPSAKKKVKKIAERVFWALIIIGFVTSLIVMIVQLDIKDERFKQKQKINRTKTNF